MRAEVRATEGKQEGARVRALRLPYTQRLEKVRVESLVSQVGAQGFEGFGWAGANRDLEATKVDETDRASPRSSRPS